MPKDSIRLSIILLVLEREDSIGKSDMENYRSRLSRPTLGEWYMVGGYSRFILHIPRIYIFGFETQPRSMGGFLLVLRQVCQKRSEPEIGNYRIRINQVCASNSVGCVDPLTPTTFASSFAPIVDRMHMDAISSISPSICFIRLSSKEPEVFCTRAKTSIGLICIDVGEFDQFCTLSLPLCLSVSLSTLYPFPCLRIYPRYPIPIILRRAIPGRLVKSRSRIRSMQNRRFANKRICRSERY